MGENLIELQKQKEDIQILLSTLEEAYRDASITKEHYDEVKGKNQKKLEEINLKIIKIEKLPVEYKPSEIQEKPKKPGKAKPYKKPAGRQKPEKTSPPPEAIHAIPAMESPAAPPPSESSLGESDYSGIPQPLTDIEGESDTVSVSPDKSPGSVRTSEPGTLRYTADEIKDMLGKIIKEIKPQGIEVIPRVDKIEVQLEKLKAYIEAMKDERSGGNENTQRLTEELGELRSSVSGIDRKVSESDMKVFEINEALGDLRPARFLKSLQDEDKSIKIHDARLDKLDDLNSVMLKKLGQIEEVLKRLGSLEKIVSFSKEAAKRLLEIENREKKINRIADKIDGIFMELNKRLDEFVLYRAKQDTLDELSQEMMKSLDDISTRMEKYAEKGDLDMLKDMFQTELASIRTSSGTSPEVQRLEAQKTEIESLVAMLDEQFKAGALPENEYKKTKQINMSRLSDIEKKIEAAKSGAAEEEPAPAQSPEQWKEGAVSSQGTSSQPSGGASVASSGPGTDEPGTRKPEQASQEAVQPVHEGATDKPKPMESPAADKQQSLLSELEDSLMKGLISREAFEKTRKLIPHRAQAPHRAYPHGHKQTTHRAQAPHRVQASTPRDKKGGKDTPKGIPSRVQASTKKGKK
jgi:predicted  nucleic acid-binding Zn-ribbon protein